MQHFFVLKCCDPVNVDIITKVDCTSTVDYNSKISGFALKQNGIKVVARIVPSQTVSLDKFRATMHCLLSSVVQHSVLGWPLSFWDFPT